MHAFHVTKASMLTIALSTISVGTAVAQTPASPAAAPAQEPIIYQDDILVQARRSAENI